MKGSPKPSRQEASALLIILAFVTLITVLVVSLLLTARFERTASSLALGRAQAGILADYAADLAVERLREAIDAGRTFTPGSPGSYTTWASEPGRIHVFSVGPTGNISRTAQDMFSAPPGADAASDANNVDLNKASLSGKHAITGTAPKANDPNAAPWTMKIGWINLLADATQGASKTNPATSRIAYWVDDESCKVNVNTADGSNKVIYNSNGTVKSGDITKSFGFGTPSEISLGAFGLANNLVAAIATYAATNGFNSTADITRVAGVPSDFYSANKFDLTYTSRTPELNMFGEPRIYLFPTALVAMSGVNIVRSYGFGGYADYATVAANTVTNIDAALRTGPINFIYPISAHAPTYSAAANQLPAAAATVTGTINLPLAQCLTSSSSMGAQATLANSGLTNFPLGMRIAQYMDGKNSLGQGFAWPQFAGATSDGFAGKYTPRQIDSMALQIIEMAAGKTVLADQNRIFSQPTQMVRGFLTRNTSDPSLIYGLGRAPKFNEIYIEAAAANFDPLNTGTTMPYLQLKITVETMLPKYYGGVPMDYAGFMGDFQFDSDGNVHIAHSFNQQDRSIYSNGGKRKEVGDDGVEVEVDVPATDIPNNPPSAMDTRWMEGMLRIKDQNNVFAGVDLMGWPYNKLDNDQALAAANHSDFRRLVPVNPPRYWGSQTVADDARRPTLGLAQLVGAETWSPGSYHSSANLYGGDTRAAKPGVTTFKVEGGVAMWSRTGSGAGSFWEVAPLDSLRGQFTTNLSGQRETTTGAYTGQVLPALRPLVKQAVIPVNFELPLLESLTYSLQVSDPLVNKFPADWVAVTNPDLTPTAPQPSIKVVPPGNSREVYMRGGGDNPDFPRSQNPSSTSKTLPSPFIGDNPGYRPSGGGDPLSVWLPIQDIRIPKQARFPSVGALNSIRTGMIPDDTTVALPQQKGTPWRSISFASASSNGQATLNGKYPDWVLLDLFTVPFVPQAPYELNASGSPKSGSVPPIRILTSGGSTEGRLNINNPLKPYPFSEAFADVAQTPPERTLPLQALFYGLAPTGGTLATAYNASDEPIYTAVDAVTLASAVQSYLSSNGPFMLPGQLANVGAISNNTYSGVAANAQSRNDLLKSIVGAVTTQSNSYSIWVVTQTFKKSPKNVNYDRFEPGDIVTGEVRRRYLVERFIETGKDGVPGNVNNPGTDAIVGTADDPLDPSYHPAMTYPLPYRWKILATEDVIL